VVRGYKKRADGSTTSYFTREVDPATKAMLDQMKQPKRIDPSAAGLPAPPPGAASAVSAWNKAGTWEEKDLSTWAIDTIKAGVKAVTATSQGDASSMGAMLERMKESSLSSLAGEGGEGSRGLLDLASEISSEIASATVRVTEVKSVEGQASVRSSRGVTKHTYDLAFEADFEIALEQAEPKEGDAAKKPLKVKGCLKYTDVTSSASGPQLEVSHTLKKAPAAEHTKRVNSAVEALKGEVNTYLTTFDTQLKAKSI